MKGAIAAMVAAGERSIAEIVVVTDGDAIVGNIVVNRRGGEAYVEQMLFADLGGPSDGTIAVSETRLPGLADHLVLPVTHTGMLFSGEVAAATSTFLQTGRFRGVGAR